VDVSAAAAAAIPSVVAAIHPRRKDFMTEPPLIWRAESSKLGRSFCSAPSRSLVFSPRAHDLLGATRRTQLQQLRTTRTVSSQFVAVIVAQRVSFPRKRESSGPRRGRPDFARKALRTAGSERCRGEQRRRSALRPLDSRFRGNDERCLTPVQLSLNGILLRPRAVETERFNRRFC